MFDHLKRQLERDEDRRTKPYRDTVGKLTIGVGRNLEDVGLRQNEIDFLLKNDIDSVQEAIESKLPWVKQLDEAREGVLINMGFNMGVDTLLDFVNTLEFIRIGNYDAAAEHMLASKWATQVGKRAKRLAEQMKTGVWQ